MWFLLSLISIVLALTRPKVFRGMKEAWLWIGEKLRIVVSPVVLAVIYFVVITPTGFLSRLLGRDALRLRCRGLGTYWEDRRHCDRSPSLFFKQQF